MPITARKLLSGVYLLTGVLSGTVLGGIGYYLTHTNIKHESHFIEDIGVGAISGLVLSSAAIIYKRMRVMGRTRAPWQDPDFVIDQDNTDNYTDPLSLDLMEDPYQLNCGHYLDKSSLDDLLTVFDRDVETLEDLCKCPICRHDILQFRPDPIFKEKIVAYRATLASQNTTAAEAPPPTDNDIHITILEEPSEVSSAGKIP